ncbi:MAG: hypothetical protein K9N09_02460 [Candidatus Cloacimonetes bacterium]|nr:hypothetical protein [Candidatus Cloacimonadota bacterium]MCF7813088.1 hypothetical protein [Candidatus Cloacimonadota bacterium]MCF7867537.1 hypothetical protein [Candidatus Cloacimonadota bacterium]MCF7883069.1 hypothetical protein [Candidatus Cloacimonadota bacterium]
MNRIGDSAEKYEFGVDFTTFDLGLIYKINPKTSASLVYRNIVDFWGRRIHEDEDSNYEKAADFSSPNFLTLGVSYKYKSYNLYLDSELLSGYYGSNKKYMKFWFIRAGAEKFLTKSLIVRSGITYPVMAETSSLGNILDTIPNPKFNAAVGLGYQIKNWILDTTLFFNPGMSYVEHKPVPGGSISIRYNY